ncbi:MAG: alpha/beta hydrolase [Flavobacteriales bacterium]|nr:alpha/beta hydrolase [Flavobacteriales bacterium]
MKLLKYEYVMLYNKVIRAIRTRMDIGPEQLRIYLEKIARFAPVPQGVASSKKTIHGVSCQIYHRKKDPAHRAILYLHGGAFAFGSPTTHRSIAGYLCLLTGREVIVPDYRLAPEHPYPAALDDCESVYLELLKHFDNQHIALVGDSAGGNLSATLTVRCIERGHPVPASVSLLSAWLDLREESASARVNQDEDSFFDKEDLKAYAKLYAPHHNHDQPEISPLCFDKLANFPPVQIQVAHNELLFPDSEILAKKLEESGVSVSYEVCEKLFHSWQVFPDFVEEGKASVEAIAHFVERNVRESVAHS